MTMRCKSCGKENPAEIHSCTPYLHYEGVTGNATLKDGEIFDFVVTGVNLGFLTVKITSGKEKGKYTFFYNEELDDSITFNI